ncbi:hypothetical protein C427_4949 [Paraglaciecola psychrophila 170]|uniref:Uncharacterized protein n=1 Tax=Paraglaciecola psychrophila 170 TaxID=1129794 RepID=K7AYP7_9ALTE|nr:hypothetical protein C427_4949 [Paraglaciecola psychrophila 170]GAC40200.1 hypothetical protein GPSY_4597 [Paraglaciecola psychrophila 170]
MHKKTKTICLRIIKKTYSKNITANGMAWLKERQGPICVKVDWVAVLMRFCDSS